MDEQTKDIARPAAPVAATSQQPPTATAPTRRASDAPEEAVDELKPTFYWAGLPVYECKICGPRMQFPGKNGPADLAAHMESEHPTKLVPTGLVGERGEALYREV